MRVQFISAVVQECLLLIQQKCVPPTACHDVISSFSISLFWSRNQSHSAYVHVANALRSTTVCKRSWIKVPYSMMM